MAKTAAESGTKSSAQPQSKHTAVTEHKQAEHAKSGAKPAKLKRPAVKKKSAAKAEPKHKKKPSR